MIVIDEGRCSGCGVCVEACPEGAIVLRDSAAAIERHLCTGCADCLPVCPQDAIYEVEAAPVRVAAASAPAEPGQQTLSRWQSSLAQVRPVVASTLAAAAPLAVDVLAGLARRWLDERSLGRKDGDWSGPGTGGRQRRRRRGRRWQ
jgi:NAD-dependent dihydropyrimidine dehydrogenase PreA subunit